MENMEIKEVKRALVTIQPREEDNNDIILKADNGKEWTIKDKWEEALTMNKSEFYQLLFITIGDTAGYVIDDSSVPEEIMNKKLIEDPDNPFEGATMDQMMSMMKSLKNTIEIVREEWEASKRELKITDVHMRQIFQYNQDHKLPMPENLTEEEKKDWDILNGLNDITDDKVMEIFGSDHPITQTGDHDLMVQRLKDATQDFANWISIMTEYKNLHNAYCQLVELEESKNIEKLKVMAENEPDEKKKEKMLASINEYNRNKYLDFLADELDESTIKVLINAFTDEKKVEYWLKRTRDKLSKININTKFILELSQFENRFLDAKYHKASNILLLYFMNIARYIVPDKNDDPNKIKTCCMQVMFDRFIRDTLDKEVKQRILNNILAFEDQMLPHVPEKKEETN